MTALGIIAQGPKEAQATRSACHQKDTAVGDGEGGEDRARGSCFAVPLAPQGWAVVLAIALEQRATQDLVHPAPRSPSKKDAPGASFAPKRVNTYYPPIKSIGRDCMRSILIAVAVVALAVMAVVLIQHSRASSERNGWATYAEAREQGMTVEALEAARDRASGTSVQPWLDFELALKLYEQATPADLERAAQIAGAALESFPAHPAAAPLRKLQDAIGTFLVQASSSAS